MGSEILSLTGLVTAHFQQKSAHNQYLDETDPTKMDASFATYRNWFHARTAFAVTSAVIWLYALIDVSNISVQPVISAENSSLQSSILLTYRF
ncbi:MAG: hypothetical protein GY850_45970 [bacterium]|nr:hypothetical protein [bacterium]